VWAARCAPSSSSSATSSSATAKIDTEEQALNSLTTTLGRGLELAIAQSSSTATTETRLAVQAEVDGLIEFVVRLGNTRFGDDYLFGGTRGGEAPFRNPPSAGGDFRALQDGGGNPVDPSGSIQIEVGDGRFVTPNHNGTEVFLDTDALASLYDLSEALGANDVPGITASIERLRTANGDVQELIARQGARVNDDGPPTTRWATWSSPCRRTAPTSATRRSTRPWWS
jgi:flagellar hook-associated protein 3 FlgL